MAKGTIKRYDFRKGFGFIADDKTGEDFFFHKSEWQGDGPIRKGISVKFVDRDSERGPQAESVMPLDGNTKKAPSKKKAPAKPASIEDRVSSLESAVGTWKIVGLISLAAVIALAVERFML